MKEYVKDKITIYTPTYNRAFCINNLYESLLRQTNKNFEWLIVDDGSEDETKSLVDSWIEKGDILIRYIYQENKGKQEAVNLAHSLITNELNTCVDSDDYLVDDAVDYILKIWNKVKRDDSIAGFVGLDAYKDGKIVGSKFPNKLKIAKFSDFDTKHKILGDKKFIYITKIIHKFPKYPSIANEKFPAPGYLYRLIDQEYDLYLVNKVLCIVEYLEDGISKNKFKQFMTSPNSFAFYRHERMRLSKSFKEKFKNAIHYVNSCLFAKKSIFKNNDYVMVTFFALPFGLMLNLYLKNTNKKGVV